MTLICVVIMIIQNISQRLVGYFHLKNAKKVQKMPKIQILQHKIRMFIAKSGLKWPKKDQQMSNFSFENKSELLGPNRSGQTLVVTTTTTFSCRHPLIYFISNIYIKHGNQSDF